MWVCCAAYLVLCCYVIGVYFGWLCFVVCNGYLIVNSVVHFKLLCLVCFCCFVYLICYGLAYWFIAGGLGSSFAYIFDFCLVLIGYC